MIDDDLDPMIEELRAEDRWRKRRHAELMRHPDCRDPDHPGCDRCEEEEE